MTITDTITRTLDRIDVSKLTHVDLSKLDARNVQLPTFQLPTFQLPLDAERVGRWVRDAAYVGLGAAVVVGQETEQRVRHLATTVSGAVSDAVATTSETVTARVRSVATTVTDAVR